MNRVLFQIIFIYYLLLLLNFIDAQDRADFLITENPAQLQLLNRYQQKISFNEKFAKYTPWKIINKEILLSDQFNKAIQVEYDSRTYFIVWDQNTEKLKGQEDSYAAIFENVIVTSDTVQVTKQGKIAFSYKPLKNLKKGDIKVFLPSATLLKRIFKKDKDYFCLDLSASKFGWVRLINNTYKSIKKEQVAREIKLSESLINQIKSKIENINNLYVNLYADLNKYYNDHKNPPYWSVQIGDKTILLKFYSDNFEAYSKSINYLVNDLQTIVAISPFAVSLNKDVIEIKKKE